MSDLEEKSKKKSEIEKKQSHEILIKKKMHIWSAY